MSSFPDHERRFKTAVPMGQCLLMPGVRYEVGAAGGPTGRGDTRLLSSRRAVCPLPVLGHVGGCPTDVYSLQVQAATSNSIPS